PGFYLVGDGRRDFERTMGFRAPITLRLRRALIDAATPAYLGAFVLLTAGILAVPLHIAATHVALTGLIVLGVIAVVPASYLAVALLNRFITAVVAPNLLSRLEWADRKSVV